MCTSDPFVFWLTQWRPTDFSFTAPVFIAFITFLWVLVRRVLPFYFEKKWPADQALKEKRVQAELEIHRSELGETCLMRR